MPYSHNRMLIPNEYDARAKLTPAERQEIYDLYKTGKYSQRQLARKFGVSRRLITFYVDPERHARHKERYAERQAEGIYYNRDKHREQIKKHRRYKQQLKLEGKLHEKE